MKDGKLSKREASTLKNAFFIMDLWTREHLTDEDFTTVNAIQDVVLILNEHLPKVIGEVAT